MQTNMEVDYGNIPLQSFIGSIVCIFEDIPIPRSYFYYRIHKPYILWKGGAITEQGFILQSLNKKELVMVSPFDIFYIQMSN